MPQPRVREFTAHSIGGGLALLLGLLGLVVGVVLFALAGSLGSGGGKAALIVLGILVVLGSLFAMKGLNTVAPGQARVVQLFGRYRGTIRKEGLRWVNPLTSRTRISTRVRNHETAVLKVNDAYGNPIESRFAHLAYAPEIASAMLQRQQAGAVVAARRQIVDGAVGMVEAAITRIAEEGVVELDQERKATMVSNLMVMLCGDRAAQPVLNTGTLYQ